MFCGGIFACKPNSEDLFVCSDGVEMNQSELLNIVRGVLSLLHTNPLSPNSRKVLFVEAANTYIRNYRGYIFGASTYHTLSVPLLTSTMERVINCANSVFSGSNEVDLMDYSSRATFYHCIRQLLSNSPGAHISNALTRTFNSVKDMTVNAGNSYQMEPKASGDFQTTTAAPEERSKGEESQTETSVTDTSNASTSEISFPASDVSSDFIKDIPQLSSNKEGIIAYEIHQTASFTVRDGVMHEIDCDNSLMVSAKGTPEAGPLLFAVVPANIVYNQRVNKKIIDDADPNGIYKCEKPYELLTDIQKVLIFNAEIKETAPPLQINRTYITNGNACKITFSISSPFEIRDIIIGFDSNGFENARSDDNDARYGGPNVLVSPRDIPPTGGETIGTVIGDISEGYAPPSLILLICTIHGATLGDIIVKTSPSGNYSVGTCRFKLSIARAAWNLPVQ